MDAGIRHTDPCWEGTVCGATLCGDPLRRTGSGNANGICLDGSGQCDVLLLVAAGGSGDVHRGGPVPRVCVHLEKQSSQGRAGYSRFGYGWIGRLVYGIHLGQALSAFPGASSKYSLEISGIAGAPFADLGCFRTDRHLASGDDLGLVAHARLDDAEPTTRIGSRRLGSRRLSVLDPEASQRFRRRLSIEGGLHAPAAAHQASKAARERSHTMRWRSFLSRTFLRSSSSRGSSRSKVMLAGWKSFGSAWVM